MIRNVPIETIFVPRTRKEIKCCEWFSVEHLPTHKTDPVSRNHLGINANSFFMIMPFVKRLKKWINEQTNPNGSACANSGKKAKNGDTTRHLAGVGVVMNSNNASIINANTASDSNANSQSVFFKNNAGHRRQRHKSMGDFDSTNMMMTHDSGMEINCNETLDDSPETNHIVTKPPNGNRKLLPVNNMDHMYSIVEPILMDTSNQNHLRNHNNNQSHNNGYKNGKQMELAQFVKIDKSKKKLRNGNKSGHLSMLDPGGDESENECPLKWRNLFNPPKLSQLLINEPCISMWRNVRLNKDIIMNKSINSSGKL